MYANSIETINAIIVLATVSMFNNLAKIKYATIFTKVVNPPKISYIIISLYFLYNSFIFSIIYSPLAFFHYLFLFLLLYILVDFLLQDMLLTSIVL